VTTGFGAGAGATGAESPIFKVLPANILFGSAIDGLSRISSWMLFPDIDAMPLSVSPYFIVYDAISN
jgi:hypothetical protein